MADVQRSPSAVAEELASDDWPKTWRTTTPSPMADVRRALSAVGDEQAAIDPSARSPSDCESQLAEGSVNESARVHSDSAA